MFVRVSFCDHWSNGGEGRGWLVQNSNFHRIQTEPADARAGPVARRRPFALRSEAIMRSLFARRPRWRSNKKLSKTAALFRLRPPLYGEMKIAQWRHRAIIHSENSQNSYYQFLKYGGDP
jgi:hypothetical protein